ncbi:hypothetical protein [Streptomyces sp. NPDC046942]|uniref:hypothetical protein n=1 Tax=Streptomyces sp. NPDC046942 TaxID=3155137 RepID=UPI00340E209B
MTEISGPLPRDPVGAGVGGGGADQRDQRVRPCSEASSAARSAVRSGAVWLHKGRTVTASGRLR